MLTSQNPAYTSTLYSGVGRPIVLDDDTCTHCFHLHHQPMHARGRASLLQMKHRLRVFPKRGKWLIVLDASSVAHFAFFWGGKLLRLSFLERTPPMNAALIASCFAPPSSSSAKSHEMLEPDRWP
ncbi:uncharacterized protein IUM83_04605 [Phytophthora cinnamomi]|uniref:uncharacterized protein n=1 Tax=Phytophthora cinnamomi TaxID=4785 RepID=UPI00355AC3A1|nr:hypothetical protein IUM83_04605 [Phytophthora cinnamomi]